MSVAVVAMERARPSTALRILGPLGLLLAYPAPLPPGVLQAGHWAGWLALGLLLPPIILFGDLVSLHMAEQAGVDPGPIAALEYVKAHLRPAGSSVTREV